MITYAKVKEGEAVYLDGKRIGTIKQVMGGWAYFPTGHTPGETFPSVAAVKRSIEAP